MPAAEDVVFAVGVKHGKLHDVADARLARRFYDVGLELDLVGRGCAEQEELPRAAQRSSDRAAVGKVERYRLDATRLRFLRFAFAVECGAGVRSRRAQLLQDFAADGAASP